VTFFFIRKPGFHPFEVTFEGRRYFQIQVFNSVSEGVRRYRGLLLVQITPLGTELCHVTL